MVFLSKNQGFETWISAVVELWVTEVFQMSKGALMKSALGNLINITDFKYIHDKLCSKLTLKEPNKHAPHIILVSHSSFKLFQIS